MADLIFSQARLTSPPVHLVFGEVGDAVEIEIVVAGVFPAFGGTVRISTVSDASIAGVFPAFAGAVQAEYVSGANRPLVGAVGAGWQLAVQRRVGAEQHSESPAHAHKGVEAAWQGGALAAARVRVAREQTLQLARAAVQAGHQEAAQVPAAAIVIESGDGLRDRRASRRTGFQEARAAAVQRTSSWQERLRHVRRLAAVRWQPAAPVVVRRQGGTSSALRQHRVVHAAFEEAIVPPPGLSPRPGVVPPPFDPCYLPNPHLVFKDAGPAGTGLLFICERHAGPPALVVVPIKRVYVVINEVSLRRVDGNLPLPAFALSLSLDADSWTWGFNASLPASTLEALEPDADGSPVELEALINGQPYRLLAERLSRERQFGQAGIRVQGRGKAALLDAPYAAQRSFGNPLQPRTAQQLMADVLTVNGVGIGWDVAWGLTDWLVPAGAFSHQGSFVSALGQIAAAAGGYLQPHPTDPLLRVLPRYPVPSWQWGSAVPDVELPAAVTTRESIEWLEKPRYNRVFVSGTSQGLLGQVTRQGSAGDLIAPMVTDALATHADALRQRGIAVLSDTGRQANVTLRLPVLPETGVIVPGKFVRYVDGTTTRLGIVRSTSVDAGRPEVWQTIGVETRA
ncbi:hypothetical protein [Methylibium rhizosphaerae]|uniref:hypothetical protein n=1 Tax=Methylibium rhizosphaerae TaxID=2570323 RepID=UPI001125C65C|nr:hypothetical protein [Methylibium rhizosphaerae]